jgi:hypothetical protein
MYVFLGSYYRDLSLMHAVNARESVTTQAVTLMTEYYTDVGHRQTFPGRLSEVKGGRASLMTGIITNHHSTLPSTCVPVQETYTSPSPAFYCRPIYIIRNEAFDSSKLLPCYTVHRTSLSPNRAKIFPHSFHTFATMPRLSRAIMAADYTFEPYV